MPDINDAWAEKRRLRWMRPGAHKFLPPGSLSPAPAPFDRTAWKRRCEAEADALEAQLIARERKRLLALKSELLDLKRELLWRRLRRQFETRFHQTQRRQAKANYNPDQPRVPAGDPDGGQWTSGIGSSETTAGSLESFAAARRRGQPAAYCIALYAADGVICSSVPPSRRRACWAQAAERFANCLSGRPIPPLNF